MFYLKLSLSSLVHNRRQYTSLFLVCAVGITIMLSAVTITDGMLRSVRQKARQYYGGDIQFMGGYSYAIPNAPALIEQIRPFVEKDTAFYQRFDYDAKNSAFFYEGESVRQRIFKGVDFAAEKDLFAQFTFCEGGAPAGEGTRTDCAVISEPIARKLGVHAGDEITLQVITIRGHTNTVSLYIAGIFQDSSLFGMYTSYIDISTLRTATGYPASYVNRIGFYFKNGLPPKKSVEKLQADLEGILPMFRLTDDKNEFYDELKKPSSPKPLYAIITLDANIKDLEMLIDAIRIMVTLIVVILAAIIAVGIGSTYKVIVMRRITDIGIYRALGMKNGGVRRLFLLETGWLLAAGLICGVVLSLITCLIVSRFNFSFIPAFDIFLSNGHLLPFVKPLKLACLAAAIVVTTLLSVLFTIRDAVHISPVGALATTA